MGSIMNEKYMGIRINLANIYIYSRFIIRYISL